MQRLSLTVDILDTFPPMRVTVSGRVAWALFELINSGEGGCTPIDHPGPRWSGYVHKLRKAGFNVETIRERHGGPFPGQHARYVLRSRVVVVGDATQSLRAAHG